MKNKVTNINMGLKIEDLLAGPWRFTIDDHEKQQEMEKPKLALAKKEPTDD
jgi:hypothetical protein